MSQVHEQWQLEQFESYGAKNAPIAKPNLVHNACGKTLKIMKMLA